MKIIDEKKSNVVDVPEASPVEDEKAVPASKEVVVSVSIVTGAKYVNARKSSDPNAPVLAVIPEGTAVESKELPNGWSKIWYDGKEAYMMTKYLSRR